MNSKENLLNNIHPGMKLNKNFFLMIYGYEISYPGFAEKALCLLEKAGTTKSRDYYESIVSEYETNQEKIIKNVSEWYRECDKDYTNRKEGIRWGLNNSKTMKFTEKRKDDLRKKLQKMSR